MLRGLATNNADEEIKSHITSKPTWRAKVKVILAFITGLMLSVFLKHTETLLKQASISTSIKHSPRAQPSLLSAPDLGATILDRAKELEAHLKRPVQTEH